MKRFSILCCLVLLLNVLCPVGLVHAETVATPTDLCDHMASCTNPTYCRYCGAEGDWDVEHNWDYYSENCAVIDGADGHHYVCQDCGETTGIIEHWNMCDDPTHCIECGYEGNIKVSHYMDGDKLVSFGAEGHGFVCDVCGQKDVYVHYAYCDDPTHCEDCGYEGTIETIYHTSDFAYISDGAEGHHYGCKDCGYVSWSENHYASCDDPTYCEGCGYEGTIETFSTPATSLTSPMAQKATITAVRTAAM